MKRYKYSRWRRPENLKAKTSVFEIHFLSNTVIFVVLVEVLFKCRSQLINVTSIRTFELWLNSNKFVR